MDRFLDPGIERKATVLKTGLANGKPWAIGVLYAEGSQVDCWVHNVEDQKASLKVGETYEVSVVKPEKAKKDGDIEHRVFIKTDLVAHSQGTASKPRYRLAKATVSFLKDYGEMFGLKTTGHWTHEVVDHLIRTIGELEIFPDLAQHSVEQ